MIAGVVPRQLVLVPVDASLSTARGVRTVCTTCGRRYRPYEGPSAQRECYWCAYDLCRRCAYPARWDGLCVQCWDPPGVIRTCSLCMAPLDQAEPDVCTSCTRIDDTYGHIDDDYASNTGGHRL